MRQIDVFYNDTRAGVLIEETPGKGYSFKYKKEYLLSGLPPISVTFPKIEDVFVSEYLFSFFANIIPEGTNRKVICRILKIDENDLFSILMAMANKDFIGAVNLRKSSYD